MWLFCLEFMLYKKLIPNGFSTGMVNGWRIAGAFLVIGQG